VLGIVFGACRRAVTKAKDWIGGALLAAIGLGTIVYGLIESSTLGRPSVVLAVGVVSAFIFVGS